MATNQLIPFYEGGERVTCVASAAVTGKRFVSISGNRNADGLLSVAPAAAGGKVFGVATWDADTGKTVTVVTIPSGCIVPVRTGVILTAGQSVTPATGGVCAVAAADARGCGIVLTGAAADADAMIQLAHHTA